MMQTLSEYIKITFKQKLANDVLQLTICEDNKAIGKVRCKLHNRLAFIEYLSIDEYSRYAGKATILMNKCLAILKSKNIEYAICKAKLSKNDSSQTIEAFYALARKLDCNIHIISKNRLDVSKKL